MAQHGGGAEHLAGELEVEVEGMVKILKLGDRLTVNRGQKYAFRTPTGMIMEEICTTHIQ